VTEPGAIEGLLRQLAPQALGVVARRHRFGEAEDAVQEALVAAARRWPESGLPDNPLGWLVRVADRRLVDAHRSDAARRRREEADARSAPAASGPGTIPGLSGEDDSLLVLFMCCHPALPPSAAIPLTLRAVGGLTTAEIAAAFLVPEATMAKRITRAKARVRDAGATFAEPSADERAERLSSVLRILYLLFNEGYTTSAGPDLARPDLSIEAIRHARLARAAVDDPEVDGLLALMLLTEARRPARTGAHGELVPLAEQDRTGWDRTMIDEGFAVLTPALARGALGPYRVQAAVAGVHAEAESPEATDWARIAALYGWLEDLTASPLVRLNRAVAVGEAEGPVAGLALLDGLDGELDDHHRVHAARAHLLEAAGRPDEALVELRAAIRGSTNVRERDHLTLRATRLNAAIGRARLDG